VGDHSSFSVLKIQTVQHQLAAQALSACRLAWTLDSSAIFTRLFSSEPRCAFFNEGLNALFGVLAVGQSFLNRNEFVHSHQRALLYRLQHVLSCGHHCQGRLRCNSLRNVQGFVQLLPRLHDTLYKIQAQCFCAAKLIAREQMQ
jgi:hypothetical protein